MDLRSVPGFWPSIDPPSPPRPPLAHDESCDVAIIGAGITGALIAHTLSAAGLNCIVLDRRSAGAGSTAASTALLLYELDTPLTELAGRIGFSDAAAVYRHCSRAVRRLVRTARSLPDAGPITRRPSIYLASTDADAESLRAEARARRRAGIHVQLLSRRRIERLFPFSRAGAIRSTNAAECDPLRLTRALLGAAERRSARIYEHTPAASIAPDRAGVVIRTERGPVVRASRAIIATGYEAVPGIQRWAPAELVSTFAIATAPLPSFRGWAGRSVIWETARPYLYMRTCGDRAIIGGGDEPVADPAARDALIPAKADSLIARFNSMFPALNARAEFAWAGTFGQSPDGLSYIAPAPELPGVLLAVGLGGNGMTMAMVAAQVAAEWCRGITPPALRLFALDRPGLHRGGAQQRFT